MKKLTSLLLLCVAAFLMSCEGDPGPVGPQGPPGPEGGLFVASAFEIAIDFTANNGYEYIEPYGFDVYPSDVTLVYILWEVTQGFEVWRLTPQTTEFEDGTTLTYNYDFTDVDVRFFLDGTTDFSTLSSAWTQNQIFRVVVVPADNVDALDVNNLDEVLNVAKIDKIIKK
ncbi:hypothetical protein [Mangrovimonas futianensis]|uniref:hypothetical protein n=1 Tax=Mangrovimonas futianensis TaxID=2895523 RepID=UPI001E335CD3|nr:hypothetical protein [Mangrovimonas futianensis]MCF1422846.1 hypothetical protein [Mangrovimonas futianensis]